LAARLIESLAATERLAELFLDISTLQAMLDFEVALARAETRAAIVPKSAADRIAAAAHASEFDMDALSRGRLRAGTPGIPVVKGSTEKVGATGPEAAGWVHWAATSQDVADTALVLLLKRAETIISDDLGRLEKALVMLSEQHKTTVTPGRTLMQAAPPVAFGLKVAGWQGAVSRTRKHLESASDEALVLQFGGASAALASLGDKGTAVPLALAEELGLRCPKAPWHAHRDRLANLICCCGVLTGTLGKMARDISLLMQSEGGRSGRTRWRRQRRVFRYAAQTKSVCALTLAAAERVPALVSSLLTALVQEHERAVVAGNRSGRRWRQLFKRWGPQQHQLQRLRLLAELPEVSSCLNRFWA
jgi:3-carboxy-cis,cis-muconate cycloisomerase